MIYEIEIELPRRYIYRIESDLDLYTEPHSVLAMEQLKQQAVFKLEDDIIKSSHDGCAVCMNGYMNEPISSDTANEAIVKSIKPINIRGK